MLACGAVDEQDAPPRTAAPKKPKQPFLKRGEGVKRRVEAYKHRKPLDAKAGNSSEQTLLDQCEQQEGAYVSKAAARRLQNSPGWQHEVYTNIEPLASTEELDASPQHAHANGLDRDARGETAACRKHVV
jgi:hypothetical protein